MQDPVTDKLRQVQDHKPASLSDRRSRDLPPIHGHFFVARV